MNITVSHQTDVGVKRGHNEDYYLSDEDLNLYIICDGMGGHAAGEVASELTCKHVQDVITNNIATINTFKETKSHEAKKKVEGLISDAIIQANSKVYNLGSNEEDKKGMGTTIVMALIIDDVAFIAHAGDSRLYFLREKEIVQLTEDHSFVNEMLKAGIITPEQAKNHPKANVITRSVGIKSHVEPELTTVELKEGDSMMLCSDGLYEYYDESELVDYMLNNNKESLHKLIQGANERGGKDNITTIIVTFGANDSSLINEKSGNFISKTISKLFRP
jgi:serine/threonine protein phosphatase PrpC